MSDVININSNLNDESSNLTDCYHEAMMSLIPDSKGKNFERHVIALAQAAALVAGSTSSFLVNHDMATKSELIEFIKSHNKSTIKGVAK